MSEQPDKIELSEELRELAEYPYLHLNMGRRKILAAANRATRLEEEVRRRKGQPRALPHINEAGRLRRLLAEANHLAADLEAKLAVYKSQPVITADEAATLGTLLYLLSLIEGNNPEGLVAIERHVREGIAYTYGDEELAAQLLELYEEQIVASACEEAEHGQAD